MKTQKTVPITAIFGIIVIGLIISSPMTIIPSVNAQSKSTPLSDVIPSHAKATLDQIREQVNLHSGWVGMMSWDGNSVSIDYLGPMESNPYKNTSHDLRLDPSPQVNDADAIKKDTTASGTAIFKEVGTVTALKSSDTTVNLFNVLNAMSSDNNRWIQVGLFYNNYLGTVTNAWHLDYNSIETSNGANTFSPVVSPALTMSTGDTVKLFINADTTFGGQYTMGENDITNNHGASYTFSLSGDTGHTINLGEVVVSGSYYPSGPQMEEHASGTNIYKWNTQAFTFDFYDTSTSSSTTSVTGWNGQEGSSGTVSTTNSPASATFTYN